MKTTAENSSRVNTVPCMATNQQCIVQMAPPLVNRKILVYLYPAASEALHLWPSKTRSALNLKLVPSLPYRCLHANSLHPFLTVALAHRLLYRILRVSAWPSRSTNPQGQLDRHLTTRHRSCREPCRHRFPAALRQLAHVLLSRRTLQPSAPSRPTVPQITRQVLVLGDRTAASGDL